MPRIRMEFRYLRDSICAMNPGETASGTLVKFNSKGFLLRLDDGSYGFVRYVRVPYLNRFSNRKVVKMGDRFTVTLLKVSVASTGRTEMDLDGRTLRPDPWDGVELAHPVDQRLTGIVTECHPEGVFLEFESGFRALIPNGEVSWDGKRVHAADFFDPGDRIEVVICSFDHKRRQIIASRRKAQSSPWESIDSSHVVGQRLTGRIDAFLQFGAIVQFSSGCTGLVHDKEISWTEHSAKASEILAIDDMIEVVIMSIDAAKMRINASYRMAQPNPWEDAAFTYPEGSSTVGTVIKTATFGLFVKLINGCVGLIHRSNIPLRFTDVFEEGDRIDVIVLSHDVSSRRMSLAMDLTALHQEIARIDDAAGSGSASGNSGEEQMFLEGTRRSVVLNYYERNPRARKQCIWHYGTRCVACNQALKDIYGEIGENLIHVHHLKQLADMGTAYQLDPIRDLRPVCPNCHAIIHQRRPPYSIEEIKTLLAEVKTKKRGLRNAR